MVNKPEKDSGEFPDHLLLDGDWIDDIHTFDIIAPNQIIKFERKGHRCTILVCARA